MSILLVISTARDANAIAKATVSDEGNFDCAIRYPDRTTSPANLSEALSESNQTDWQYYRVCIGDLDCLFSRYQSEDHFRLDDISAYQNPARWTRGDLPAPNAAEDAFIVFDVPEADGEVYTLEGVSNFILDEETNRLRISFADEIDDAKWLCLADKLFALVTSGHELLAFQFEDFTLPSSS